MDWTFDTRGDWRASVPAIPRGDRSATWYDLAVPEIAAQAPGSAPVPCFVVVRVTSAAPFGIRGKVKRLMDALHDQRLTGAKYAALGVQPPLADDHPQRVIGLAVDWRSGRDQVEYELGTAMTVRGRLVHAAAVDADCPNDVGASSVENAQLFKRRQEFGQAVADEWRDFELGSGDSELALVIRHPIGRDEDNTWEGWIGAIAGARWNEAAWPNGAPLRGTKLKAIASLVDPAMALGVGYELYAR
jgi:hypothetical protein